MAKKQKHVIDFGKFYSYIQIEGKPKQAHDVIEEEKELLIKNFKQLKKAEHGVDVEEKAIKYLEKKLQELIKNVVYIEGYVQQIESGNEMLKINPSVKELATNLSQNIEEVEKLSSSLLEEEKKALGLAKHIKQILDKAKSYQKKVFG